jgi:hypothetical protein
MSAALNIGARVFARRLGKADVTGEVVWVGPSKFGDGWRYRIRAADGSQHWVDEKDLTVESNPASTDPKAVRKGSRVRVTAGAHEGVEGEVYIASSADRFGVRDDQEETYWFDGKNLEII